MAFGASWLLGTLTFPMFPRRVLMTDAIALAAPLATFLVVTGASMLGLVHVMRIDPARALEG